MMHRRKFITATIASLPTLIALFGMLQGCANKLQTRHLANKKKLDSKTPVINIATELRSTFSDLIIPDEVIIRFITDYQRIYQSDLYLPLSEEILQMFILSTDFVQTGCVKNEVSYQQFYSPHDNICYNPFMLRAQNLELENNQQID